MRFPIATPLLWPGPVLIYGSGGELKESNPDDDVLVKHSRVLIHPDIASLITQFRADQQSRFGTIQVDDAGSFCVYDIALVEGGDDRVVVLGREANINHGITFSLTSTYHRHKELVEISSDFAWECDANGCFIFVTPRGALGYPVSALIGRAASDLAVNPEGTLPFVTRSIVSNADVCMNSSNGVQTYLKVSARPVFSEDGAWCGARGVCRDVTLDHEREVEVTRARTREKTFNHIVNTFRDEVVPSNILNVAAETIARGIGAHTCHIFRRMPEYFDTDSGAKSHDPLTSPHNPAIVCVYDDRFHEKLVLGASFGVVRGDACQAILEKLAQTSAVIIESLDSYSVLAALCRYHRRVNGAIVLLRDARHEPWDEDDRLLLADLALQIGITGEQVDAHDNILRLSRTDSLTGLFNRRAFLEEIERRHKRLRRERYSAALLFADLDNFKKVNDVHGHAAGDAALQVVRDILIGSTRPTDLIARLGGDEFAIWLEGADRKVAVTKARLLMEFSEKNLRPLSGSPDAPLGLSLGIAVHDSGGEETLADLMVRADQAMYKVKNRGKGGYDLAPGSVADFSHPDSDSNDF